MLDFVGHAVHYAMVIAGTLGVALLLLVPMRGRATAMTADHARRLAILRERAASGSLAVLDPLPPAGPSAAPRDQLRSAVVPVAAVASVAAAGVHAAVIPSHAREGAVVGLFFLLVAVAQCAWGAAAIRRPDRVLFTAGLVGSAVVVAIWAVSRIVGLPSIAGGRPEPIGALDVAATGWELVVIACCGWLLHRPPSSSRASTEWPLVARGWAVASVALLGVVSFLPYHS
ncbi:hypothetical protein [Nocardioides stalactiti]|uniref:hypothetical protein n=1 Tax=Nocardioides stalactiti TaxID=2755356 RepID=UPI0016026C21|nr:hypothetical protein [Nocardioides stalactiti]